MIAVCNFWNNARGFGFVTDSTGTQHFLHIKNFERGKTPVLSAYISFVLGPPLNPGRALQAVNAKFATAEEIKQSQAEKNQTGMHTLAAPQAGGVQ